MISIIVPTRNRAALLARLLDSLTQLRYPHWEGIIVDDGSLDDTAVVVEEYRRRGLPLTYLYQPWQKMGAARNLGLRRARGEIVAFTDDDCTVTPHWLDALSRAFDQHPEALGVQGRTVTDHSAMTPFTRQVEQLEGGQPYRTCNIAYRAEIVRALGGFDPHLIRGEDVVMGMRVLEHGSIVFASEAIVVHPPRPKEWANRAAWRTLLESEIHFKRTYPRYAPARSQTLSLQKPEHILSRWIILPVRRYWRWHWAYVRRAPVAYLRHVPLILREKLALLSILPFFIRKWRNPAASVSASTEIANNLESTLISLVIPTRNRASLLPRLFAAIDGQEYPNIEVIIVDDASTDCTPELLRGWAREGRMALRLPEPMGSYAARNLGWRQSHGEIVAFTDDDCLPEPGWLSALARAFSEDGVAGVQGVTLASPGEITPFTHQIEQTRSGPPYRTCNIAYLRETLESLGGFDDRLRWYADNILGLRARQRAHIAFAPDAIVHHPPRPKEWRDRVTWHARFAADAEHRQWLQALRVEPTLPAGLLPILLWVLRPLVKQSWAHLQYFARHPLRYLRQTPPLLRDKRELGLALLETWRAPKSRALESLPPLSVSPLLSVVIVTRDRPALLAGALAALDRQHWAAHEVIVVDHGAETSPPLSVEHPRVRIIRSRDDSLGAARQCGVAEARGEIVAFTDDDCLPDPDWLDACLRAFQREPGLWGVQGRTLAERGPIGSHAIHIEHSDPLYQTCNIAYRRVALDRAGGFDTRFQGWFEDTALGARVLQHGPIGWAPAMLVTHRARPRHTLDRHAWQKLLRDERLLATEYPRSYRRTRGPSFYPTVIVRWLIGSLLKTLLIEALRPRKDGLAYARLVRDLAWERHEMFIALIAVLRGSAVSDCDVEVRA